MTNHCNLLGKFELSGIPPAPRGVPQIEVTFDIDANGILNVSAEDKTTGKKNKITITNDKGRLSQEDIDRMVREAEKFKEEDDKMKAQIEAKNQLENFCYSVRNTLEENKEKIGEENKKKGDDIVKEMIEWLDTHQNETKEVYEGKQKEMESKMQSIFSGMYQQQQPPHQQQYQQPGSNGQGPTVEEVD